jgi:hypothetical protein
VRQTRYSAAYLVRALWEREAAKGLSIVVASGTTRARTTTTGAGKWRMAAGSRTPADSRQHSSKRGYTHRVGQSPAAPVSWGIDLRTPRALVITIGVNVPLNNKLACAAASTAAFGCLTWPLVLYGRIVAPRRASPDTQTAPMNRRAVGYRSAAMAAWSRSRKGTCAAFSLRRARLSLNHSTRSISGKVSTHPDPGGHSIW